MAWYLYPRAVYGDDNRVYGYDTGFPLLSLVFLAYCINELDDQDKQYIVNEIVEDLSNADEAQHKYEGYDLAKCLKERLLNGRR